MLGLLPLQKEGSRHGKGMEEIQALLVAVGRCAMGRSHGQGSCREGAGLGCGLLPWRRSGHGEESKEVGAWLWMGLRQGYGEGGGLVWIWVKCGGYWEEVN